MKRNIITYTHLRLISYLFNFKYIFLVIPNETLDVQQYQSYFKYSEEILLKEGNFSMLKFYSDKISPSNMVLRKECITIKLL